MAEAETVSGTFRFELVSPEKVLAAIDAVMVTIPGDMGEFGVLVGHQPLLSSIRPGVVTVTLPSGEQEKVFVAGGFADVSGTSCSVLAEEALPLADLDRPALEQELAALKDDLTFAKDDAVKAAQISARLRIVEAKLETFS